MFLQEVQMCLISETPQLVDYHVEVHRIELHLHQEAKVSSKCGRSISLVALYMHLVLPKIDGVYVTYAPLATNMVLLICTYLYTHIHNYNYCKGVRIRVV